METIKLTRERRNRLKGTLLFTKSAKEALARNILTFLNTGDSSRLSNKTIRYLIGEWYFPKLPETELRKKLSPEELCRHITYREPKKGSLYDVNLVIQDVCLEWLNTNGMMRY